MSTSYEHKPDDEFELLAPFLWLYLSRKVQRTKVLAEQVFLNHTRSLVTSLLLIVMLFTLRLHMPIIWVIVSTLFRFTDTLLNWLKVNYSRGIVPSFLE